MCGIAGYISLHQTITEHQLTQATALMHHRGPDAGGFYFSPGATVGLAHRRLSILDLSTAANQPMFSADGRFCIVFNGEVYNFNELKSQLRDKGVSLKTRSDTEVILELFAQQGTACFASLNGMFAFAIYDIQQQQLTLCRDHAGIKPLFVYHKEGNIIFASELKVIKSIVGKQLQVNPEAIPYFLHLGFIPQPLTIYKHCSKFPAAHYLQLSAIQPGIEITALQPLPFWKLEQAMVADPMRNEKAAKKELNALLLDAVEKQLISDVPIGTFLSGGVDSSLVTALASTIAGNKNINTFSISIDEGKYNEANYARQVSAHLNTRHHEFRVKEKEVLSLLDTLLPAYDEPFADTSAFPTMMVSRLAREHVTVALSGDGGDELFHGYGMYQWARRLASPGWQAIKTPLHAVSKLMGSKYQRMGKLFDYTNQQHIISHVFSQEQYYFSERELAALLPHLAFNFDAINELPRLPRTAGPAERQSFWDFNHYLKDDLLVKVDRASMQYSLESRVPLLDYRLVEFAYNLDESLKINKGTMKYLLKEVLYDYVPREIFQRPKWGFSIPLDRWLTTDLHYLLQRYTSEEVIARHGLLLPSMVSTLTRQYLSGTNYLFNRVWLIIVLHWWLEENTP